MAPRCKSSATRAASDGVNAKLTDGGALPAEYAALELTQVTAWDPIDSVLIAKGLAWSQTADLSALDYTIAFGDYLQIGAILGFNGVALFFDDIFRTAPFEPVATVPDFLTRQGIGTLPSVGSLEQRPDHLSDEALEMARSYSERIRAKAPVLAQAFERRQEGSNWWLVDGAASISGAPILANDPHLALSTPAALYPMHLRVADGTEPFVEARGMTHPGFPGVGSRWRACALPLPPPVGPLHLARKRRRST